MASDEPEIGDKATWNWNGATPGGEVSEKKTEGEAAVTSKRGNTIKKAAKPDDPAIALSRSGNDVVKNQSELQVEEKHPDNKNGGGADTAPGGEDGPDKDGVERPDRNDDVMETDEEEAKEAEKEKKTPKSKTPKGKAAKASTASASKKGKADDAAEAPKDKKAKTPAKIAKKEEPAPATNGVKKGRGRPKGAAKPKAKPVPTAAGERKPRGRPKSQAAPAEKVQSGRVEKKGSGKKAAIGGAKRGRKPKA
ncbi:uncharacterized protein KY384_000781 [Bacidia gigantensis]|uniref:uncharacterized protein n=1 Tax=Bacidia gigantensis TaxID=2732470 RepID=UPI001D0428CA|nr:uncharacterized protein KY384_000781 [Bacidia gigantensis]KAG8526019.1 hypothetical protein KY384_000781 [Bacidia gigantensis]